MTTENADLIEENENNPGAIPERPLRPSELLILRHQAIQTKREWEALAGQLATYNLRDMEPEADGIMDDAGKFCDQVIRYCSEELKKQDLPKRKR